MTFIIRLAIILGAVLALIAGSLLIAWLLSLTPLDQSTQTLIGILAGFLLGSGIVVLGLTAWDEWS